jgi:hypothetical protein
MPEFISKLNELAELSDNATLAIALAEAYNPEQLSFLGPHNEMRNALFHIMEMVKAKDNGDKCNNEFKAAKSHFRRAGCDAYELLCLSCIKYFFEQAQILIEYVNRINAYIPAIIKIQEQRKKNKWKERLFQVGIAIAIAAISFILGIYIIKS